MHEVQADGGVGLAVYLAGDGGDDQLGGGADDATVQVAAVATAGHVAHGHVQVGIGAAALGGDGAGQGDDLKVRVEHVGLELLGVRAVDAQGHIVHRSQAGDSGQLDLLHRCEPQSLLDDLVAGVQTHHISAAKFPIIHRNSSCFPLFHIL